MDPLKDTLREFASTKSSSSSKPKKVKAMKCSITSVGRPTSKMLELHHVLQTSPCVSTEVAK